MVLVGVGIYGMDRGKDWATTRARAGAEVRGRSQGLKIAVGVNLALPSVKLGLYYGYGEN